MVRISKEKILIKILLWGMAGSGKTTIIDTIYRFTKENEKDIAPTGKVTKVAMASGSTLYFDRGIFQSKKRDDIFYHIYSVAGQKRFAHLRKKVFKGTDGVIFIVDSQTHFFEDNIKSLKELNEIARGRLITKIPLIIMLNKQDLVGRAEVIGEENFKQVLKDEHLWFEPEDKLHMWNPKIYKTCALYDKKSNIFRSFSECARRSGVYFLYGKGSAPVSDVFKKELTQLDQENFLDSMIELISSKVKSNEYNIKEVIQQTVEMSKEYLNSAWEILSDAQIAYSSGNLEKADNFAYAAKAIFKDLDSTPGFEKANELLKKIDNISRILTDNKKKIHKIMYNGSLERCLLHDELDIKCTRLQEIKKTIISPKIYGFFMYQFPRKEEELEYDFLKKENEIYKREIQKFRELIQNVNEDPFINIDIGTEATSLGIKTCEFCRIARSYDFGILLLNPPNPNAFLEAGMFLSLGKKLILINNESRLKDTPYDLSPFTYIKYDSVEELEESWNNYMLKFLTNIKNSYKAFPSSKNQLK